MNWMNLTFLSNKLKNMDRQSLYKKVKELGIQENIKSTFGRNFTQVSNADLEAAIRNFSKKATSKAGEKSKDVKTVAADAISAPSKTPQSPLKGSPAEVAVIHLCSLLYAKRYLTHKEMDEVLNLLK